MIQKKANTAYVIHISTFILKKKQKIPHKTVLLQMDLKVVIVE